MVSAPVETASATVKATAAEAGASARRKTPLLSAGAIAAESAGANAALAARLGITAGGLTVASERLWRFFKTVVSATPARAVADGRLSRSFVTVVNAARVFASIESVAVIKRSAWRVIPRVVEDGVVMMPIETPVVPPPPVAPKESDSEANSEEECGTVIPNARIGIPARPGVNRTSINDPRIVRRNVDDFGADRHNLNVGTFGRYGLLRRGVEIACCYARRRIT